MKKILLLSVFMFLGFYLQYVREKKEVIQTFQLFQPSYPNILDKAMRLLIAKISKSLKLKN